MNKLNHVSTFVFGILTTVFVSGIASANTAVDDQIANIAIASKSTEAKCASPLNRDYHDVLSAYNSDTAGEYKFSGCGGVL